MSSLYQFVRETLEVHRGSCSREELLSAIERDRDAAAKLRESKGFARLLINMKHSGFVELDGSQVRRTARRVGRRRA